MLSENVRDFLRAAAWILMGVGVLLVILSGLRQFGLMSPPIVNVNGNPIYTALSLAASAVASVVQGGILLVLLSIDERIQNRSL